MNWTDEPIVGFDTETTGIDVTTDRIITAALVYREPGYADTVDSWIINPGIEIPQGSIDVHGISNEQAQKEGQDPKEALDTIANNIAQVLKAGIPIVAYNATYDVTILENELKRYGLLTVRERIQGDWTVVDPLVLDRAFDKWRKGNRKLITNLEHYGVKDYGNLHTAEDDVKATLDLLDKMTDKYPQLATKNLAELQLFQATAHKSWADGLNKWFLSQGKPGDVNNNWLGKV